MSEQNIPFPDPHGIAELSADIRAGQLLIEQMAASLTPAEMTEPGPDGGWSIKDHIAHLTAWRRMVLAVMRGKQRWEGLGLPPEVVRNGTLDSINEVLYKITRDENLDSVLTDFRSATAELMAQLASMKDADLERPFNPINPNSTAILRDGIIGDTYGHDLEHLEWIGELLKTRSNQKRDLE
jgi:hypothetical protein